jgi:hypothetical protein
MKGVTIIDALWYDIIHMYHKGASVGVTLLYIVLLMPLCESRFEKKKFLMVHLFFFFEKRLK